MAEEENNSDTFESVPTEPEDFDAIIDEEILTSKPFPDDMLIFFRKEFADTLHSIINDPSVGTLDSMIIRGELSHEQIMEYVALSSDLHIARARMMNLVAIESERRYKLGGIKTKEHLRKLCKVKKRSKDAKFEITVDPSETIVIVNSILEAYFSQIVGKYAVHRNTLLSQAAYSQVGLFLYNLTRTCEQIFENSKFDDYNEFLVLGMKKIVSIIEQSEVESTGFPASVDLFRSMMLCIAAKEVFASEFESIRIPAKTDVLPVHDLENMNVRMNADLQGSYAKKNNGFHGDIGDARIIVLNQEAAESLYGKENHALNHCCIRIVLDKSAVVQELLPMQTQGGKGNFTMRRSRGVREAAIDRARGDIVFGGGPAPYSWLMQQREYEEFRHSILAFVAQYFETCEPISPQTGTTLSAEQLTARKLEFLAMADEKKNGNKFPKELPASEPEVSIPEEIKEVVAHVDPRPIDLTEPEERVVEYKGGMQDDKELKKEEPRPWWERRKERAERRKQDRAPKQTDAKKTETENGKEERQADLYSKLSKVHAADIIRVLKTLPDLTWEQGRHLKCTNKQTGASCPLVAHGDQKFPPSVLRKTFKLLNIDLYTVLKKCGIES